MIKIELFAIENQWKADLHAGVTKENWEDYLAKTCYLMGLKEAIAWVKTTWTETELDCAELPSKLKEWGV